MKIAIDKDTVTLSNVRTIKEFISNNPIDMTDVENAIMFNLSGRTNAITSVLKCSVSAGYNHYRPSIFIDAYVEYYNITSLKTEICKIWLDYTSFCNSEIDCFCEFFKNAES